MFSLAPSSGFHIIIAVSCQDLDTVSSGRRGTGPGGESGDGTGEPKKRVRSPFARSRSTCQVRGMSLEEAVHFLRTGDKVGGEKIMNRRGVTGIRCSRVRL
jgi:hypothetical protein